MRTPFLPMLQRSLAQDPADLPLFRLAQELRVSPSGPWLAGGAIRRALLGDRTLSDFDFFFRDAAQLEALVTTAHGGYGFTKVRETDHHVELSDGTRIIQAIRFQFYPDPEAVVDSFDYTICQLAFDGTDLIAGDFALWDLGRRRLAVHKVTYPVPTLRRLIKYANQGFTACSGCLQALVEGARAAPAPLLETRYID